MTLRTANFSVRIFATSVLAVLGLGYVLSLVFLFNGYFSLGSIAEANLVVLDPEIHIDLPHRRHLLDSNIAYEIDRVRSMGGRIVRSGSAGVGRSPPSSRF